MSSTSRRLAVTGLLCAVGTAAAVTAQAAAPTSLLGGAGSIKAPVPVVTSPNVSLLTTVPAPAAISIEFAKSTNHAYVSGLDRITVLDTTDPRNPTVKGTLVNALFENEAMTYGERRKGGELTQFVLSAIDIYQASPDDPAHVNSGAGKEVAIVDVTNPAAPTIRSYVKATTSTHTAQCVSAESCDFAYTAGEDGKFSILDLRDLDKPKELKTVASVAAGGAGPNSPFGPDVADGSGHYWEFEKDAPRADGSQRLLGTHTGSGGAQVFDVTDPLAPKPINATNAKARTAPYNDFIFHNSMRPNSEAFVPGAEPDIKNGNVLLVTEEDYVNDGDEVECSKAGSFQTWHVPDLDAAAYDTRNPGPGFKPDTGTIAPLDITNAPDEFGGGLTTPAGGFCSAHWFDVHQDGFVAQGYYQQGLRIMDVRDARNIKQHGYSTSAATETWDAYWVPKRNGQGKATGEKTNLVYTADAARGVDVYEVDLSK